MSFIETIPEQRASDAVHDMYQHQKAHWGYVPNYAMAFSHRPELMARWAGLLAEVRRPADDYRYELATFAAAQQLQNLPCALVHGDKLAQIIGTDKVIAIGAGDEDKVLTPADAAIVRYARAVAADAGSIDAAEIVSLRTVHGLGDAEIFDIATIAAARCFFTKVLDAVGTRMDDDLLTLNPPLYDSLTSADSSLAIADTQ